MGVECTRDHFRGEKGDNWDTTLGFSEEQRSGGEVTRIVSLPFYLLPQCLISIKRSTVCKSSRDKSKQARSKNPTYHLSFSWIREDGSNGLACSSAEKQDFPLLWVNV